MEIYQTEEQQVEAIKSFWKNNGNAVIAGLVIGFAGFIGYGFYQENKLNDELAISKSYQELTETATTDSKAFITAGETFVKENNGSSYSALTALALAKQASTHKDWAQVEKYLTTAIEQAPDAGIKAIATLRLARVQIQLEQADKAIATLAQPLPESFTAAVEEIKGDAYVIQNKNELARNAYQVAMTAGGETADPALQMKLDNLAVSTPLIK